jgi:hypothetical protein
MATNPLDGTDAEFDAAITTLGPWLAAHFAELGLTATENTTIQDAISDWPAKYGAVPVKQAELTTVVAEKDAQRSLIRGLLAEPNKRLTDPAKRSDAGLNLYAERRARVPVPTTTPLLMVDTSKRYQHTIEFKDAATPNSRAKPDGVHHLDIWWCVGPTPPTGIEGCTYLATDTNSPYVNNIASEHAGKIAHYMARWVNTRGEFGPWCETVSATVPG